jgi:hypothetical protein
MTALYKVNGDILVGTPVTLADGTPFYVPAVCVVGASAPSASVTAGSVVDTSSFGSVNLQVQGLSGGDTLTVSRSVDGTNYVTQSGIAQDYTVVSSIVADGIYSYPGGDSIKYTKTGSASSPTVTLRAGS